MAYDGNRLSCIVQTMENQGPSLWSYITADTLATVIAAGYLSDALKRGMRIGDRVMVAIGTLNTAVYPSSGASTADVGEAADFTATPQYVELAVVSFTANAANLAGGQTTFGGAATDKISFYGVSPPIVQRSGAAQATSLVGTASSADVNTDFKAAVIEIMNTLAALGLWKGSA
jgi:hypothetical protein